MLQMLGVIGADVAVDERLTVEIDSSNLKSLKAPYELVKTMRASFLVLGPMLARYGKAQVSLPGGCAIGARPVDQHLKALSKLGADINISAGYVSASVGKRLRGCKISMDVVTVGGTQNTLMAATLADGVTEIHNAAKEPEISNLAQALSAMGAKIEGAGTSTITVEGVAELGSADVDVMSDRIEAGTFLAAVAATRGTATLHNACPEAMTAEIGVLREAGAQVDVAESEIAIDSGSTTLRSVEVSTAPYPGLPTDMQAQIMALCSVAAGSSRITETVFESRFMHVPELRRLGASITFDGMNTAVVRGVSDLKGAPVMATDLRASSSLVIGGLVARGETIVDRIYHIDRGYESIEEKLQGLGADVQRITD